MMNTLEPLTSLLIFPAGLTLLIAGMFYDWFDRKLVARFQNRVGPRWFQPVADVVKLFAKEQITPGIKNPTLFFGLPLVAISGAMTAALYVPLLGLAPAYGFAGDLIVTIYLLSLLTICMGLAGWNTGGRFALVGATRALTQVFAYEAPFLLALLGPAMAAGSWEISTINDYASTHLFAISQPVGFIIALIGLMGKLELPPFDAPEAETEIVAGALTEYSGRGLAMFRIGKAVELVVGITLVSAFYLGGLHGVLPFFLKTLGVLFLMTMFQVLLTRMRIDQTVGLWWRFGTILVLAQLLFTILWKGGLL
jgi:NADH-quinone oxidoreductase subunit H